MRDRVIFGVIFPQCVPCARRGSSDLFQSSAKTCARGWSRSILKVCRLILDCQLILTPASASAACLWWRARTAWPPSARTAPTSRTRTSPPPRQTPTLSSLPCRSVLMVIFIKIGLPTSLSAIWKNIVMISQMSASSAWTLRRSTSLAPEARRLTTRETAWTHSPSR